MHSSQWEKGIADWLGKPTTVVAVELVRDWSQSKVLRLEVVIAGERRSIFAKQAHTVFNLETEVYRALSKLPTFPAPAGACVRIGEEEWLLLEQARGDRLADSSPNSYPQAAAQLAGFHELAAQERWPEKLGLTQGISQRMSRLLPQVLNDVLQLAQSGVFTAVDLQLLATVRNELVGQKKGFLSQLSSFPLTLAHGDCHSGNLFISTADIQLIDWGSVMIAPGLLDLAGLLDVALRMRDQIGDEQAIIAAYWTCLSERTKQTYGDFPRAWQAMRMVRSLLELEWFVADGDDFGTRANRELLIISECLPALN